MSWNAENINHHRHPDIPRSPAEEAAEKSSNKRDDDNDPERDCFYARRWEGNDGPDRYALHRFRQAGKGRFVCGVQALLSSLIFPNPSSFLGTDGPPALPDHKARDARIDDDGHDANHQVDVALSFQILDQLRAAFRAANSTGRHN